MKNYKYPYGHREDWLKKMKEKPSELWPTDCSWSFENKNKIYGTPLFDDFYLERDFKDKIIDAIDKDFDVQGKLFEKVWMDSLKVFSRNK